MELHELKPSGKGDSKKQTLVVAGTILLVVLAFLQLRKMGAGSQASTPPSGGSYAPDSGVGASGGTSGSSSGGPSADALSSLSDRFTALLQGVSDQAQLGQAQVQAQLQSQADTQAQQSTLLSSASAGQSAIAGALSELTTRVTDLSGLVGAAPKVAAHPVSVPSGEHPVSVPLPVGGGTVPTAGAAKPSSTSVKVSAGQSWNTIAAESHETLAQLRAKNGGQLNALKPGQSVKI